MGKKIGIAVVGLLVVVLGAIAMQPDTYRVERSADIAAPADVVFEMTADLKNFDKWSPWNELDATMKKTYGDKTSGVGATYEWSGNSEVGKGRMTVTEVRAPTTLRIKLDFLEPMAGEAMSGWDFTSGGDSKTTARWWVEGKNDFMGKAFGLFMDMDAMLGGTYEKGLKKLGEVAKTETAARAKAKADAEAKAKAEAEAKAKLAAEALAVAGGAADGAAAPAVPGKVAE